MKKHISVAIVTLMSMLLSSCSGFAFSEDTHVKNRMETIVSAIKGQDEDTIKSLFSKKAVDGAEDWEKSLSTLLDIFDGDITSYSMKQAKEGHTSVEDGKKTVMMLYSFYVITESERYLFFLVDYPIDTQNADNEGLYMLEVRDLSYTGELDSLQDRMKAGISIIQ